MKKVSVITICYNDPFLEKTCESIVNQTWQDFEWVVVDGGSNKETLDKFEKYKKRIDKFVSEPDNGIYDACNKGVNLATGEYVIFMNAGDAFYSLDVLNNIFSKHNYNSGVLYGDTVMVDNNLKHLKQNHCAKIPHKISKHYFYTSNICTQSIFVKKELFYKYGLHNLKYKILGDLDRNLAFISNGEEFEYVPEIVSCYDRNGVSSTPNTLDKRLYEQNEIIKTYFSPEEISFYESLVNFKYKNIFERIFSIKKSFYNGKFYNTVTILGVKIKIKDNNEKVLISITAQDGSYFAEPLLDEDNGIKRRFSSFYTSCMGQFHKFLSIQKKQCPPKGKLVYEKKKQAGQNLS